MDKYILENLKELKQSLKKDGFVVDAVFGSFARGEETNSSDVDILYHLESTFFKKYSGFIGFKRLDEIKKQISQKLNREVDLAPINNLSSTAKTYILKEAIYV